ncbi:hypothetical protein BASA81_006800 [Batrachochytrium salamandrivorans]|nr:hypothetical protein BASA81_006800 [Batrachochytrium salamandrivorans]
MDGDYDYRQAERGSRHSLVTHEPDNPIRTEANARVRDLTSRLKQLGTEPIIIAAMGGGSEKTLGHALQVLRALGMEIPMHGLHLQPLIIHDQEVGMNRVLGSVLAWEDGLKYTEFSVVEVSSLQAWNLARAFVATYLNLSIPQTAATAGKVWAFAHPRAAYFLPVFQSILGLDQFRFVHLVTNPLGMPAHELSKLNREYKWTCPLVMPNRHQNCDNTRENRVQFWAEVNYQAFGWCKRMDVDRYVVVRTEDLMNGECISRLVKALRLPGVTQEMLTNAELVARKAFVPPPSIPPRSGKRKENATAMPTKRDDEYDAIVTKYDLVKRQMNLWKYPTTAEGKQGECEGYPL